MSAMPGCESCHHGSALPVIADPHSFALLRVQTAEGRAEIETVIRLAAPEGIVGARAQWHLLSSQLNLLAA